MNRKALVAEFIGTFALIFVGVGAIAADYMLGGKSGLVGIALAHGLAIGVMISATMAISGGHLNPAVTVGAFVAKKIDLSMRSATLLHSALAESLPLLCSRLR